MIVEEWFQTFINLFPSDNSRFIQTSKDQFANPVGYRLKSGLAQLFDELSSEREATRKHLTPLLDKVIRVQAVQGFAEEQVKDCVLALKRIVREKCRDSAAGQDTAGEDEQDEASPGALSLADYEARIDFLAEESLRVHQACRKQLDELKGNEQRRRTYLQRRMGRDAGRNALTTNAPVTKRGNGS